MGIFDFWKKKDSPKVDSSAAESLVIDVSKDMNAIINNLTKNYKSLCDYDEILRISENDRFPILD